MSISRSALLLGTAVVLAGCGADDIASPGEGVIVVPAPTPAPAPAPAPAPTPTPTPGQGPAANCPSGTSNVGTITDGNGAVLRNCQISGTITGNLVLEDIDDLVYSLSGQVNVGVDVGGDGGAAGGDPAVLTIEAGAVIFGSAGPDFLLVNRGSQLFAEGTADRPIVFTSRQNIEGTAGANSIGQWGGVVVLGRGPISDCTGAVGGAADCQNQVEGPSAAFYGGDQPNDNSGRIRFVQVRYAGFEVSTDNELNGITLAGVGRGTTFDHIQVHNNSDDGIEWFGGRVNGAFLVLTGNDDDSIDTDFGWKGALQFVLVQQRTAGGDHAWEADSSDNDNAEPRQDAKLANFTVLAPSAGSGRALYLRGGGDYTLLNGIVTAAPSCLDIDQRSTIQAADPAIDENGPPVFNSIFFSCTEPYGPDTTVTQAEEAAIFEADPNNVPDGTSTLNGFFPGANEMAVPAVDPASFDPFFVTTDYIGAFADDTDTWFDGWTCDLPGQDACTTAPSS